MTSTPQSAQNASALQVARAPALAKRRTLRESIVRWIQITSRWLRTGWMFWSTLARCLVITIALRINAKAIDRRPEILRKFLESAGGAWIKLGQILAMRSDFLPTELVEELTKLLDEVPSFPYEVARAIVESDFGKPIAEVFKEFPKEPIAAASFGQVYRVILHSGEVAAVKVKRPGLEIIIAADVKQLRILAFFFDGLGLIGSIRLKPQVDQLEKILKEEIDYHFEAANIRTAMEKSRFVRIMKVPNLYEEFCTAQVLTMEFLSGIWMNDILAALREKDEATLQEFRRRGLNLKLVARRMFDIGMRQLFEVGTFHADPHAANIVILPGNVVGYVDFGIVGEMDEDLADAQSRYFQAVKEERISEAAHAMSEMILVPSKGRHKLPAFRLRLQGLVRDWLRNIKNTRSTLRDKSTAQLLLANIAVIREFGFSLLEDAMRYYRAVIIADIIILQLDPDFDGLRHLRRYYSRRRVKAVRMGFTREATLRTMSDYAQLWLAGPGIVGQLQRTLRSGEEDFSESFTRLDLFYHRLARLSSIGFAAVLLLRIFGVKDLGQLLRLPFPVNWLWATIILFGLWRIAVMFKR